MAAVSHGLRYFICDGQGTELQKLSKATRKGYPQMLSYAECLNDAALTRRLNEDWNNGDDPNLRYHMGCRTELYNRMKSISTENRKYFFYFAGGSDVKRIISKHKSYRNLRNRRVKSIYINKQIFLLEILWFYYSICFSNIFLSSLRHFRG